MIWPSIHLDGGALWALGGSIAANAVAFSNWAYKRLRNRQISEAFVKEMAVKHLPYLYGALKALCEKSGVIIEEHPNIGFVELNGHTSSTHQTIEVKH